MANKEIEKTITDIMLKANRLGWITEGSKIHIADVEKMIYALFDLKYYKQIELWVKEKSNDKQTKLK